MINNFTCMGRLTADPELQSTTAGISVTSFCIAITRNFKNEEGNHDADFITCVAWRQKAEFICKHFGKGDLIALEGQMQSRKYQDKNGNNRQVVELVVDNIHFCGQTKKQQTQDDYDEIPVPSDDDLPFA